MASDPTPISDTDAIFARAYAAAVKSVFLPPGPIGEHDILLTAPVTQRGMAAGTLVFPEITNYLIYMVGDALQYSDNPVYTGSNGAGKYVDQLQSYLSWVKSNGDPDQQQTQAYLLAQRDFNSAVEGLKAARIEARKEWETNKDLYPDPDLPSWLNSGGFPPYDVAARALDQAQGRLFMVSGDYFGRDAEAYKRFVENLRFALDPKISHNLINQVGLAIDSVELEAAMKEILAGTPIDKTKFAKNFGYVPQYGIATYASTVDSWIQKAKSGNPRDPVITLDISKGQSTSWKDYGFKEVNAGGGAGFWPFFWAEVRVHDRWEKIHLETKNEEASINLALNMYGYATLPINAGQWDIPNIKTLFPKRTQGAPPDVLSSKYAKISSLCVGFDVELVVTFSGKMKSEVQNIISQVKETKGRMSVFGFYVDLSGGAQSTERVYTDFKDVKWDEQTGAMHLTPTKGQVYPTILGVVASKFKEDS